MTQISNGIYEDASGNLVDIKGKILVPAEKRTRDLVYSRPVGYLSPVENWNPGKRSEFLDRAVFNVKTAKEKEDAKERP